MFVRNTTKGAIGPHTFGGFEFTVSPGVSAIWTPAGEHLTKNIYRIEAKRPGAVKDGGDGGSPIPPMITSTRTEWNKGRHQYAEVRRWKIDATRLPSRSYLIDLAEKYGVSPETLVKFRTNSEIENSDIVKEINSLPVPEEVRIPEWEEVKDSPPTEAKESE